MKIKLHKYIIGAAMVVSAALPSCKKYLDYQSPAKLNTDQAFEDPSYTNSVIIGIYTKLCGSNAYGNQLSVYWHLGTDEFTYQASTSFDSGNDYAIPNYGAEKTNTSLQNVFNQLYAGVERANIACKFIPASNVYKNGNSTDKTKMQIYYGEALALRAQYYYELIRNWGDVPATFVPSADLPSQFLKNANRDSTLDHIIADLKTAEDLVPWRDALPDYGDFRFTKGAIKGLRARIALARGGYSLRNDTKLMERRADYLKYYQIAYDETLDVINSKKHGLNPVYENIFKTLHSGTGRMDDAHELMFEVAMWGQINDSNLASANGMTFSNSPSWGGAGGRSTAQPTYYYEFDNTGKDVRRDVTLAQYKVQNSTDNTSNVKNPLSSINFNVGKFRKSWTAFNGTVTGTYGVNWPILRYADILLMYAEAANELGKAGSISPLQALQLVQQRAYGANTIPVTPTDHDGFFNAVVHERLLEFGGEGIRKYDLIRWNLLGTKIEEAKAKMRMFATNADPTNNPYANLPAYVWSYTSPFNNLDSNTEAATMSFYGGGPSIVFFTKGTTTQPPGTARVYWRQECGSWTNGVLSETYISDPNKGFCSKFKPNAKELLPYPQNVLTENRGSVVQNFAYN
ncbi:putative outer membrane starch-binding protein [Mucilaginibacter yixingensis]|uniref:Putative outer membrane starch-binding protein n=1 Tax=Mucilaginibacter yixingensis TaxID=1295612 RepID=A0A2T5JAJ1_9SPHI|nr:RagB/SusD family nutrient uptake outer membrane protein [Mucilaginibacter yixingensis]PTQ97876.1 putative outer membrane starch-binding protein [Mucilaginibacter yixingensis]